MLLSTSSKFKAVLERTFVRLPMDHFTHIDLVLRVCQCSCTSGQSFGFTTPKARSTVSSTKLDMAKITSVKAREILDSRGNPTVEVRRLCFRYFFTTHLFLFRLVC